MIPHVDDGKNKEGAELEDYETGPKKDVVWYHWLLLNRHLKVATVGLLVSVLTPLLLYYYFFFPLEMAPPDGFSTGSCLLPRSSRLPCGNGSALRNQCHTHCCFDDELHLCYHRLPSRFSYIIDEQWTENMTLRPRISTVPFKNQPSKNIQLSVDEMSPTHVSITFYDPKETSVKGRRIQEKNYTYNIQTPELNIVINDTIGNYLFNTVRGPVIASENIWEIAFRTTEEVMYGLGEIPLVNGTVKVLYNHDGGFNSIPLIFSRTNNTYHGLLIDIADPTEVRVEGENQIVVRSITNVGLKFHLFTGPQPKDIMKEVRDIIGFKNDLEYWMLGTHICSEGSPSTLEDLTAFITAAARERMPYDSHCGVSPVVFHDDCKENHDRTEMIRAKQLLQRRSKKIVPHISPYIFYNQPNTTEDNSTEIDIEPRTHNLNCSNAIPQFEKYMLRKADSRELYIGTVNNKTVLYPDYETAGEEMVKMLWDGPEIDGMVLENTWPMDESLKHHNETGFVLPYFSEHFARAFNHTPQWNATRPNNKTYIYSHNQYGNHFTNAFRRSVEKEIPIIATTQWMTGGILNRQNIETSWTNLQTELNEIALSGVSGNWLLTSPICGDTEHYNNDTQTNLCVKWYMAGTFLPLIKIHSKGSLRHPLAFLGTNKANILTALKRRYSLLSHFHTILQKGPLLRPMFYQFPFSKAITDLKTQFSVGDDLLIVPNLQPSQTHVHVVMPPGSWFEFWSGLPIDAKEREAVTMTTTDADFLVLIRGGSIVAMQKDVRETAELTRLNSKYSLAIALDCKETNGTETTNAENIRNVTCQAEGEIYITDNITIIFKANSEQLTITGIGQDFNPLCERQDSVSSNTVEEVYVFGLSNERNNYDYSKHVEVNTNLCDLKNDEEIVVNLF